MFDEYHSFDSWNDCDMCHQAPADRSENPHSRLCKRCREQAIRHPGSTDIAVRLVTLSMKYGRYDFAAYSMNTYLVEKSLSDTDYGNMIHYQNVLASYYDTRDVLNSITEELLHCLELEENMDFTVLAELGNLTRREGDFETARSYYDRILRYEKSDAAGNRGMAVLSLLEGDPEQALFYIRTAYDSDPDATYVRDTFLVTLSMNRMKNEAARMMQEMEEAGTPADEDTLALLNGNMTLMEYYTEEASL